MILYEYVKFMYDYTSREYELRCRMLEPIRMKPL